MGGVGEGEGEHEYNTSFFFFIFLILCLVHTRALFLKKISGYHWPNFLCKWCPTVHDLILHHLTKSGIFSDKASLRVELDGFLLIRICRCQSDSQILWIYNLNKQKAD